MVFCPLSIVDNTQDHGGGIGTFKGCAAGGRSSAFLSVSIHLAAMADEYASQSGKSNGKEGKPFCKKIYSCALSHKQIELKSE